jgi:hypothetical protein
MLIKVKIKNNELQEGIEAYGEFDNKLLYLWWIKFRDSYKEDMGSGAKDGSYFLSLSLQGERYRTKNVETKKLDTSLEDINKAVCDVWGVKEKEAIKNNKSLKKEWILLRHAFHCCCFVLTDKTPKEIGSIYEKDRATVIFSKTGIQGHILPHKTNDSTLRKLSLLEDKLGCNSLVINFKNLV